MEHLDVRTIFTVWKRVCQVFLRLSNSSEIMKMIDKHFHYFDLVEHYKGKENAPWVLGEIADMLKYNVIAAVAYPLFNPDNFKIYNIIFLKYIYFIYKKCIFGLFFMNI